MERSAHPLAYFITFTCYGTWLQGDARGSVDDEHNVVGSPWLPPDTGLLKFREASMEQERYSLDASRRSVVLKAIVEVCKHRRWNLLAAHVRTCHVHVVVQAPASPEKVMNDFKAYASRALNQAGWDSAERKRWTRHGSTRSVWTQQRLESAVHYTLHEQGAPMERYDASEPRPSEPRPSEPRP